MTPPTRVDKVVELRERAEDDALCGPAPARATMEKAPRLSRAVAATRCGCAPPVGELWHVDELARRARCRPSAPPKARCRPPRRARRPPATGTPPPGKRRRSCAASRSAGAPRSRASSRRPSAATSTSWRRSVQHRRAVAPRRPERARGHAGAAAVS